MRNSIRYNLCAAMITAVFALPTHAEQAQLSANSESEEELQDMSDPMAIFTQAGFGFSNKGVNFKYGATYETGIANTAGMKLLEVKGAGGEWLGWSGTSSRDNSIDSVRFRDFQVSFETGRGRMIDLDYSFNETPLGYTSGSASYNFIQALPSLGPVQLFPLAGVGLSIANNYDYTTPGESERDVRDGISVPGMFGAVGMYSVIRMNDKVWFNYNPIWMTTIAGSDKYVDHGFYGGAGSLGENSILLHEVAASYQINPRLNVRYFANWTEHADFIDGDHRIEFNYQF